MTLSSAECIEEVASLGVRRVVLPRELSLDQIAAIRRQTQIELEAFVHGALCISYSGQCLGQPVAWRAERKPRPVCPALPAPLWGPLRW